MCIKVTAFIYSAILCIRDFMTCHHLEDTLDNNNKSYQTNSCGSPLYKKTCHP